MDINIEIERVEEKGYVILHFTCGILEPGELSNYSPLDPVKSNFSNLGVIIKGAMPLWLMSFYTHVLHTTRFIAVYDPRIVAAVVVATHAKEQKIGNTIQIS